MKKNIVYNSNNDYYKHYIVYTTLYTQIFNTLYRRARHVSIAAELRSIPFDVLDTTQCECVCVCVVIIYYNVFELLIFNPPWNFIWGTRRRCRSYTSILFKPAPYIIFRPRTHTRRLYIYNIRVVCIRKTTTTC